MNGRLVKTWEAHCGRCKRPALGLAYGGSTGDAAAELRRMGWRTRAGLWVCAPCAADVPRGSDPTTPAAEAQP